MMKTRYIAKPINKSTGIIALLLALAIPLLALYSCSTGTEPDEPVSLEGTSWELTSIEAINDSTWWYEDGMWEVPDDQTYSIAFKDSFLVIQADCESCAAWYTISSKDSIHIDSRCHLDVSCNLNDAFINRLSVVQTYRYESPMLHLYFSAIFGEMEGYLHFEEMETEE